MVSIEWVLVTTAWAWFCISAKVINMLHIVLLIVFTLSTVLFLWKLWLIFFFFLIKGFVYKRETNFLFRWSESLFHFLTVVWWGWLVGLSSLRRSWPEKIQPLRHCLGIVPLSWRPSCSAWSWSIFPALKPLVTLHVLLYAYTPRLLPLRL